MTWLLFCGVLAGGALLAWLMATIPHVVFGIAACAFITCGACALVDGAIGSACVLFTDGAAFVWICFEVARMGRVMRTKSPTAEPRRPRS